MYKMPFIVLFLAIAVFGQQEQERIAIINTVDTQDSINFSDLSYLTDKLREIAGKILPRNRYGIMTQQSIVDKLGSQERMAKECKEATCLADLGRKISADYIAQGYIGRFSGKLSIKVELYNVKSGNLLGSLADDSQSLEGLLAVLNEKAPDVFRKMPGVSGIKTPAVVGGIRNLESATDYEFDNEKRYLASINTEPQGAALSFDGVPDDKCSRTPCKTERPEGDVRIIARLEQYETADTTVSIKQNNQNIAIALKPNFGVLEINPAYSEGIGENRNWNLAINDTPYSLGKIKLSPGSYAVKLNHHCYENINFTAGIHKGKRQVFDMAKNIVLKKGGLVLRAELDGEPTSEPVFVNGRHIGETPFTGSVPLCAGIEIGENREKAEVELEYKDKVEYTHKMRNEVVEREHDYNLYEYSRDKTEFTKTEEEKEEDENSWHSSYSVGIHIPYMLNAIDSLFYKAGGGLFGSIEFFKPKTDFFRFGFNMSGGFYGIDKEAVRKIHPDVDSLGMANFFNIGAFVKLHPASFMYLRGGASLGFYGSYGGATKNGDEISGQSTITAVFPVGGGLILGRPSKDFGLVLEVLYNPTMLKNGIGAYYSFNIGGKFGRNSAIKRSFPST